MRTIGLVIAFALVAVGLYRAFTAGRAAPPKPRLKPGAKPEPATRKSEPAASAASRPSGAKAEPPKAEPEPAAKAEPGRKALPSVAHEESDEDITIITLAPSPQVVAAMAALAAKATAASADAPPPKLEHPPDDDEDDVEAPSAIPIVYDEDAALDEPTRVNALILVSAASQTDQGRKRRRNEDSLLLLEDHHLFVVADGMGGHAGGDVASKMAVETMGEAFKKNVFAGDAYPDVPRRGSELALAIQMANKAIFDHAKANAAYQGMGTTVVSARFSPNKQRVYVGHVGDSRCYRLRNTVLTQVTTDHTMGAQGVTGPLASHLNRAVGVVPGVKVDLIIARPRPEDIYLLCSDGLSKMVADADIQQILNDEPDLSKAVQKLVERANARGGRDNITVILVQVKDPKGLARYIQQVGPATAS